MAKGKFEKSRASAATKETKKAPLIVFLVGAILLVLVAGIFAWGSILENGKIIYPNVYIAGVDVGKLSLSAAQGEVRDVLSDAYDRNLEVQLPDRTLIFEPDKVKVRIDVEQAAKEALRCGRDGGAFGCVVHYLQAKRCDVELNLALELDTEYIQDMISMVAGDIQCTPVDTQIEMDEEAGTVTIVKGNPGRRLDTDGLYDAVYDAYRDCSFEPISWSYEETSYVEADLDSLSASLSEQQKDAYYDEEEHQIVPEVSGYGFSVSQAQSKLDAAADGDRIVLKLEETKPEIDAEKLNSMMFGEKLESRSSPYVSNANRTENLRLACEAINGTIVNPGEVFSFNDTVGERTEERGFKPATVYGGAGESVDGVGGGICQVASTIYYTTLYMNMEQVMREPHMYQVTYVPAGMDATVYWDSKLDYKFKNNRENPVKIQANVDGGHVNITFWGVKENDNYVEMSSKTISSYTSPDVEQVDETKEPGYRAQTQTAYVGAKVEAYQKVYDGTGKLLEERTISSTYKSRPNIYVVGPGAAPEEVPEETQKDPFDIVNEAIDELDVDLPPWFEENWDDVQEFFRP